MIMIVIEIQGTGTTCEPMHTVSKQWHYLLQLYPFEKETLCCQLCSTSYTAVRINNCLKRTAIKVATLKISITIGSHHTFAVNKDG